MQEKLEEVSETAQGLVPLPGLLRTFCVGLLMTLGLTLVVGYVRSRLGTTMPHWYPWGYPVFADLKEYSAQYRTLHTAAFFSDVPTPVNPHPNPVAYPPFAAMVLAPIYAAASPAGVYVGILVVWLVAAMWTVRRAMVALGISGATASLFLATLVLAPFPIVRLLNEGNVELVLWILTAVGVWAFLCGREYCAAVLWGLAAAMKLYPVILLILFLPRRWYKAFAVGVATFVGATVISLRWLGPTMAVAWHGSLRNVFHYQGLRADEWSMAELQANHSAFGLVRFVAMIGHVPPGKLTLPYYGCGALIMAAAFLGKLWKMPVANQVMAVTVFMVALPTVSYYHTLVHLYAPLLMLVFLAIRANMARVKVRGLWLTVMLFVPLFAPFTVLTYPRILLFSGLVEAAALVTLFLCAVKYPFAVDGTEAGAI